MKKKLLYGLLIFLITGICFILIHQLSVMLFVIELLLKQVST